MEQYSEQLLELVISFGGRVLAALAVYVLGRMVISLAMRLIRRALDRREHLDPTVKGFFVSLVRAVLIIVLLLSVFQTLGLALTSFVAILGAAGLAVGLAFQGSLSNFAGGVLILLFRPFGVGDFIEANGVMGSVIEIRILYTALNTFDNKRVVMPNGSLANATVTNFSVNPTRRLDMVYGIGYDDSIDTAKEILSKVVDQIDIIEKEPAPLIGVLEHGDSSINLACRVWVKRENYLTATLLLNESVKKAFDEAKITIPFPQRDVHVYNHES
ncbi:MAG: mechanosensitive ion channel [Spirochaeta sp.]|nr:mechanosensitive ion channel [Spirochaeta sp.]